MTGPTAEAYSVLTARFQSLGHSETDSVELASDFALERFVTDGQVDREGLHAFADKVAGTAPRGRNFGGGTPEPRYPTPGAGASGLAEAERRYGLSRELNDRAESAAEQAQRHGRMNDAEIEAERRFGRKRAATKPDDAEESREFRSPEAQRRYGGSKR